MAAPLYEIVVDAFVFKLMFWTDTPEAQLCCHCAVNVTEFKLLTFTLVFPVYIEEGLNHPILTGVKVLGKNVKTLWDLQHTLAL